MMLAMVVMCSGEFKFYFLTSHITSLQLVIELRRFEWTCVQCPLRFFTSWKMKDLEEQRVWVKFCFKLGKNFYGGFSDVATGLWGGLFEPYAMLRVVSAFQIGQNVHRRWSKMFRSPTILRELVQSLAKVTRLLKYSVKLRHCILCADVAACRFTTCCHISTQYTMT